MPASSPTLLIIGLLMNVITDLYLISIPLPMLWSSTLKPLRKVGLMLIFSGGLLVVACALLRSVLMLTVRTSQRFLQNFPDRSPH